MKLFFRRGVSHGGVWDWMFTRRMPENPFVLVFTTSGQEIMGRLQWGGMGTDPRDIFLLDPQLIIRDKNQMAKQVLDLGEGMFISAHDVLRVAFLPKS